jgi:hypothetical protein
MEKVKKEFRAYVKDYDGTQYMLTKEPYCELAEENHFYGADLTNDYPCIAEVIAVMQLVCTWREQKIYEEDFFLHEEETYVIRYNINSYDAFNMKKKQFTDLKFFLNDNFKVVGNTCEKINTVIAYIN